MYWNNRIVHTADGYGVYEVFYNDNGEPWARDKDAMLWGDDLEDLEVYISRMIRDIHEQPILEDDEIDASREE